MPRASLPNGTTFKERMRILTYKRTHIGDPDVNGRFGINDCMGKVRGFPYDAVIGVGGTGREPRSFGIDRKINWIGIGPRRERPSGNRRAEIVTFEHFVLFEERGPLLHSLAPALAKKMYSGRRFVFNSYTVEEKIEAIALLQLANEMPTLILAQSSQHKFKPTCRKRKCVKVFRNKLCRVRE